MKSCTGNQGWSKITHSHHLVQRKWTAPVCPRVPMTHRFPDHTEKHCKNQCITLSEMPFLSEMSPQTAVYLNKMALSPSELFLCSFFTHCFPVLQHCQKSSQVDGPIYLVILFVCFFQRIKNAFNMRNITEIDQPIIFNYWPSSLLTYAISTKMHDNNCLII